MAERSEEEDKAVSGGEEDISDRTATYNAVGDIHEREGRSIEKEIRVSLTELSETRRDNEIHVSNLIDFCPREFALCNQRGFEYNPGTKKIYPGLALTFHIGHAIHRIIQKALKHSGILRIPEFNLELPVGKFKITGTNDGLLKLVTSELLKIMEIKSISSKGFDAVVDEPLINHVCQISLYMWKAEKLKIPTIDSQRGFIIYVCKEHKINPIKVFPVVRHQPFIDTTERKLEALKTFSDTGELPARSCTTYHAQMAKRCSCRQWCFDTLFGGQDGDSN